MDSQNDNRKITKLCKCQIKARNDSTILIIFPQTRLKKVIYEAVLVSVLDKIVMEPKLLHGYKAKLFSYICKRNSITSYKRATFVV